MKKTFFLLILLSAVLSYQSCNNDEVNNKEKLEKSYNAWLDFRSKSENSYKYIVRISSWEGPTNETTITVTNGKVTERSFVQKNGDGFIGNGEKDTADWIETENEIDTHTDSGAFTPLTLDEVYEKAKNEWLPVSKDVTVYLETGNEGMLSLCGYTTKGCQDDCFTGVNIVSIVELE